VGKGARIATTLGLFVLALVGIVFSVKALLYSPPTIVLTPQSDGAVHVTMQTVGSLGYGDHPTYVSYLTENPQGQWVHTTMWQVPAHTKIDVTIYQFDSGSPLRNQQIGQVTGTIGDTATLDGTPFMVNNSNVGNGVGHTFSIPTIGLSVPLAGNDPNATLCAVAPCSVSNNSPDPNNNGPHRTITFSFMSPGPGNYPWQCFVPCALGFLFGNAGPMQTVGYMGGFMKVV
jgi:hypothetical protein